MIKTCFLQVFNYIERFVKYNEKNLTQEKPLNSPINTTGFLSNVNASCIVRFICPRRFNKF